MPQDVSSRPVYDLRSVKLPYLAGTALGLFTAALESPLGGLLIPSLFESSGITALRSRSFDEAPTYLPLHSAPSRATAGVPRSEWPGEGSSEGAPSSFATIADYARAYRSGQTTPEAVAERALAAIEASNAAQPPLRAIIAVLRDEVLKQAAESTHRLQRGEARSLLEGVPVAVKDEVDLAPYPTTVGTAFLGRTPAREDATVTARLRAAGALFIGKANMHEIGIGVTGLNPHHGTPRNPYAPGHFTGGSSSGSGAAVAAGLCPLAVGADGGGSIRIPSAFCGVVGLKPTFGRISEHGAAPLCWSVAHLGPIAATAADAALGYAVMAGPDPCDPNSLQQPQPTLDAWNQADARGLTLGVFWPWFEHAEAEVVSICRALVDRLVEAGASLREVIIADLEAARVAHTLTIAGEMAQAMDATYAAHHGDHGLDVRINLALARAFATHDYVKAQRVRTRAIANFNRALADVDVIVTPATGVAAPAIPPAALPRGESDLTTLVEIMRFVTPANLTGLPAIVFPAGYTKAGLPVGLQAIGRAWDEATLLRLARVAERLVARRAPQLSYSPLA